MKEIEATIVVNDDLINLQDELTLAKWWCELNRWEWPSEIPDEENQKKWKEGRRTAIMGAIEDKIGHKACNRQWNIDRMTDEEHELFWSGRGKNSTLALN